ncbi:uncharacterized protein LOC111613448 [Centruroides sculpturatus]|uniref:uncharacterized protein LOC111613448 n=1 Tax=Centruroides sculpturatus TaxID=218467 RepID=UPI000C6DB04B|nr:uncharacterized protein LOC111613448 [Centruroides sculpturatus]
MISFTLICLVSGLVVVNSYVAIMEVPAVDGKCYIKGKLFKFGDTYYEEEKCESWKCETSSKLVSFKLSENGTVQPIYRLQAYFHIIGCGVAVIEKDGKFCRVQSTKGKHPKCCLGPAVCP